MRLPFSILILSLLHLATSLPYSTSQHTHQAHVWDQPHEQNNQNNVIGGQEPHAEELEVGGPGGVAGNYHDQHQDQIVNQQFQEIYQDQELGNLELGSGISPYDPDEHLSTIPDLALGVEPHPLPDHHPQPDDYPQQRPQPQPRPQPLPQPRPQPGSSFQEWYKKMANKWNYLEEKAYHAGRSFEDGLSSLFGKVESGLIKVIGKFKSILSNFGIMIHRGVDYVIQKVTLTFEDVRASEIITKLEKRLEAGDETVDEFFQKVGEKVTQWMNQQGHQNIDEGLFMEKGEFNQHFVDKEFTDLMQEPEIYQQLEKMIEVGILTKEEVDILCQNQIELSKPSSSPQSVDNTDDTQDNILVSGEFGSHQNPDTTSKIGYQNLETQQKSEIEVQYQNPHELSQVDEEKESGSYHSSAQTGNQAVGSGYDTQQSGNQDIELNSLKYDTQQTGNHETGSGYDTQETGNQDTGSGYDIQQTGNQDTASGYDNQQTGNQDTGSGYDNQQRPKEVLHKDKLEKPKNTYTQTSQSNQHQEQSINFPKDW